MLAAVETVLQRHGRMINHIRGERMTPLRAFLQPVTGKTAVLSTETVGMGSGGKYLFIGPLFPKLEPDDILETLQGSYRVIRAEVIFGREGPLWQWAVCARKGGAAWRS